MTSTFILKNLSYKIESFYSNLKASIGLNFAALYAGSIPKTSQIQREKKKLKAIELPVIIAVIAK
jgi:CRISPR/Cas system endoribonuclease Cas6 (RAMP superfamily)